MKRTSYIALVGLIALNILLLLSCLTGCDNARPSEGTDNDPGLCTYTVYCRGADNRDAIQGVIINFCTDTTCTPVTSSEQGEAVFTGAPAEYHVEIVKIPDGWELAQDEAEWYTGTQSETREILFAEVGQ
ncbi:MAG: hypothetical protein IJM45_08700 [Clostridia bacterium]|nr:hypothetical protein [Clostridia bacterium]